MDAALASCSAKQSRSLVILTFANAGTTNQPGALPEGKHGLQGIVGKIIIE